MSARGLMIAVVGVLAAAELAAAQGAGGIRERRRDGSCVAEGQGPPWCVMNAPDAKAESRRDRDIDKSRDTGEAKGRERVSPPGAGPRRPGMPRADGPGMACGAGRWQSRPFAPPRDGGWGRPCGRGVWADRGPDRWAPRARGFGRGDGWGGGRGYGMGWRAKAGLCRAGRGAGVGWRAQAGQYCPRCGCGGPPMGCRLGRGYRGGW
jgi:hypothetical protein